ncbi:MgtC/SapB family protein [Actinomyces sp. B33]|uniref:MgtC/SapB family protein n=1 Tax=Actinomyces sp. B33 TaxID=2942131 RepID=UPI00234166B5|nr:MgtC/SapB family protein [Actinomyces sp. B33]MDC4232531.1 MgtC/SapB family protein [Actinomyces sp. B33]
MYPFTVAHFLPGLAALGMTLALCFPLGLERHYHLKDAGVKTHVLVGMGSCLFTLVSMHGFADAGGGAVPDPSRLAAQIVSGIGFLGAGVIFVNNDTVKGLTTAATVWVSAAIGVACGAGLALLAAAALVLHFLLVFLIGPLVAKLPSSHRDDRVVVEYEAGRGVMRSILLTATHHGYTATVNSTESIRTEDGEGMRVVMRFEGPHPQDALVRALADLEGVNAVDRVERAVLD